MEHTARTSKVPASSVADSAEDALDKASAKLHAAVDSVAEAADDAARRAKPAIGRVAAKAHEAVDKAADAAAPTADWLVEQGRSLKAGQERLVDNTSGYIAGNPLKAVGVAVVAGFILSLIFVR